MQNNYDLPEEVVKKLKSIERRQIQISKDINALGFEVYLSPAGLHIINGKHHDGDDQDARHDNVVWNISVKGAWDGGDW